MNDFIVFGSIAVAVGVCMVLFALYHIYRGVHGNLASANVGEVYNFQYLQPNHGDPERFLVKIIGVHTLTDEQIRKLNARSYYRRNDSNFQRTNHLVTGRSADGTVRNFYAERVVDCRRPLLGAPLFKAGLAHLFF